MARLPQVGGDKGNWGDILNEYLSQSLADDGSLRAGIVGANQLKPDAVTTPAIAQGAVTAEHLVTSPASDGQVLTYSTGGLQWSTPSSSGPISDATSSSKGVLQLTSDLSGSAASPKVAKINGVAVPGVAPTTGQVLTATGSAASTWSDLPSAPVSSVSGKTGSVSLTKSDVGLSNVDNTADVDKPVSSAQATALAAKAPLASPSFTGTPTGPTAAPGVNTTQLATTQFVSNAISDAAVSDASTSSTGVVQLADSTDVLNATGNDVLTAGLIPSSQGVTGVAKVQFIPNNGTVTGSPGPYTIIIEAGS